MERVLNYIMHTPNIINLTENLLYGQGSHKKCYLHPEDKKICIKLPYNEDGKQDILREISYMKILKKRGKNYDILPQYYGTVQTNLGDGYLFELICDYDGNKSITLEDIITSPKLFSDKFEFIVSMLQTLKQKLYENEIITMVLFPENIIFQKTSESEYHIRIVNDMGSSVLIPLEYYFEYFAHTKILRRWNKFLQVLTTEYNSPLSKMLIERIK